MELELEHSARKHWTCLYRGQIRQEESSEMIVPDRCPDVLQILDASAAVLVLDKESLEGKFSLSACVEVRMLYQAEEASKLCGLDTRLSLQAQLDVPEMHMADVICLRPMVEKVDVRLLNPRKVLVKVNVCFCVAVYQECLWETHPALAKPYLDMCQRTETVQNDLTLALAEKPFQYSDSLSLPANLPDMEHLLRCGSSCHCTEAKVLGNKVLFKGEAGVDLLYLDGQNTLLACHMSLPFSQMMEEAEVFEDATATVDILSTAVRITQEDSRTVQVDLDFLAQAVLQGRETGELLVDLYSVDCPVVQTSETQSLNLRMDYGLATESVRESLSYPVPVSRVYESALRPLGQSVRIKEGKRILQADVELYVLLETQLGEIASLHRKLTVEHSIPMGDSWQYQEGYLLSRAPQVVPTTSGLEASFSLDFFWEARAERHLEAVATAQTEEAPQTLEEQASIVLRCVQAGESLWDIAKQYRTREARILEANALSDATLHTGQLLMIPR